MPLIARASKTVRLKNLIIAVMCVVFCGMFIYDGYFTYPTRNTDLVTYVLKRHDSGGGVSFPEKGISDANIQTMQEFLKGGGWNKASDEMHQKVDAAIKEEAAAGHLNAENWKGPFDVMLQRELAWVLVASVIASVWWALHCQRRRAIAEDATVSPAPGVIIPWEKITKVDNTRWKSVGIVDITYTDAQGKSQKADFDDYKLQREPLLGILDQLSDKAVNAEFIDPPEAQPEAKDSNS